jgi:ABC-type lipoprotein export system ATPase subunit
MPNVSTGHGIVIVTHQKATAKNAARKLQTVEE